MKLSEAKEILKKHNEWRRDDNVPNSRVMQDSTQLGIAIDIVTDSKAYRDKSYTLQEICSTCEYKESYRQTITDALKIDKEPQIRIICPNCGEQSLFKASFEIISMKLECIKCFKRIEV